MNPLWECQSKLLTLKTFWNKGGYRIHLSSKNTRTLRSQRTHLQPAAKVLHVLLQGLDREGYPQVTIPFKRGTPGIQTTGTPNHPLNTIDIPIYKNYLFLTTCPHHRSLSWPATCSWQVFWREASRKDSKISLSCRGVMSHAQKRQPGGSRSNPSDIIWYHLRIENIKNYTHKNHIIYKYI